MLEGGTDENAGSLVGDGDGRSGLLHHSGIDP